MSQSKILPFYQGKVRDLYNSTSHKGTMVIVTSDRISAFDLIFNEKLPEKGKILTRISNHWFELIKNSTAAFNNKKIPNHIIETDTEKFPEEFKQCAKEWQDRAIWVKSVKRVDFECVVRGYIIGSGWKEYQLTGSVCGISLPRGLKKAERLAAAIFTPATKVEKGHDENVSFSYMQEKIGLKLAENLRDLSLSIYNFAQEKLFQQGIILADTKFEFGLDDKGRILLIDEVLTPDSSRFWDVNAYRPGESPPSYDKQIIRDYLETVNWNKQPPPPPLAADIITKTINRYKKIEQKIFNIS